MPMIAVTRPAAPRIGHVLRLTSIGVPSLASRVIRCCENPSPSRVRCRIRRCSFIPCGGTKGSVRPSNSSSDQPKTRSAAAFQNNTVLSGAIITEGTAESRKTSAKKETSETSPGDVVVDLLGILLLRAKKDCAPHVRFNECAAANLVKGKNLPDP